MSKAKALLALLVGVGLVTLVAVRAQHEGSHGAGNVMALTAMDYIQIKQLVNKYAFALDTGANNGYDYADLFTADGVFDSLTRGRTQGRDQLASLARGGKKGPQYINHYIMNHIIEPTADGAIGRQYLIEISHDESAQQGRRSFGSRIPDGLTSALLYNRALLLSAAEEKDKQEQAVSQWELDRYLPIY